MDYLNTRTLEFLIQLKASNIYWFNALINCAKYSPITASKCIVQARDTLKYLNLDIQDVNVFQICKAANSGALDGYVFQAINSKAIEIKQAQVIEQMKKDGYL